MKEKIKKALPLILFLCLIIFYFEYSVTILWDSAHYMSYVNILEGSASFSTWDVVRGPIFPLIIYIGNILFGKTTQGLLMNTFIYYLIMLYSVFKVMNYALNISNFNNKNKRVITLIVIITIIVNPIIFGFYHSLLTEFVAITLSILSCYLAVVWHDTEYSNNKKKYICLSIIFCIITLFGWFLKQPYVSCSLFPLIISYIITLFQKKGFKKILIRTVTIICCLVSLILGIKVWNYALLAMGTNPNSSRNPSVSLGNTLISGLGFTKINFSEEIKNIEFINEESKLSKKEKAEVTKLLNGKNDYLIIDIYEKDTLVDSDYIISKNGNISTVDSVIYIVKMFLKKPIKIVDAYVTNYFSIIDIYSTTSEDTITYKSNKKIDLKFSNEIKTIAFKPYYYGANNIFYMLPEMRERVNCYEQTNYTFKPINYCMLILGKIYLILFKIVFVFLPFALILSIIWRIKYRKNKNTIKNLNLVIILLGFSFLHVLLHAVTGAIIDRYAVPAFITASLGILLLIMSKVFVIKVKKY